MDNKHVQIGFIKAAMNAGLTKPQAVTLMKLAGGTNIPFTNLRMPFTKTDFSGINPGVTNDVAQLAQQNPKFEGYVADQGKQDLANVFKGTPLAAVPSSAADAWKTTALATGGAGLLYLLMANAKKREKEQKAQYPMQVSYA